jgi:Uma2 family endonuclease
MSTATARRTKKVAPPTNLIEEDGVPLESDWHRLAMTLLIESVGIHLHGCDDYFVGGNMFIHFNAKQARDQDFRGPDFFFVWEASLNPPRPYWAVWEEGGRYPDIIIELSSPTTAKEDHCVKKTTYERIFKTSEYFIYDPDKKKLVGWRLDGNRRYQGFEPNDKGWLWSNQLGLWLGLWKGKYQGKQATYLRFFDKDGKMIPSAQEQGLAEKLRADTEKLRADAAEAELARLKARRKKADQ